MITYFIFILLGFYLLIKGADIFVDGISSTSTNLKIPKLIISMTVVAFGTSAPELFISFQSLINGNNDVVLANVVGSTVVNSMLVIGMSALVRPIKIKNETIKKQLPLHLIIISIFSILLLDNIFDKTINSITRSDGIILFAIFLVFLFYIYKFNKTKTLSSSEEKDTPKWSLSKSIILSILGLACICIGSDLAVDNCVSLAHELNVSEKLITMIILVIGTSTPEIVMGITSAKKGEFDIIMGNIIGTNIFNIGFVLGLPIIILGGVETTAFNIIDMGFMTISGIVLYLFAKGDKKISKKEGLMMLIVFLLYYVYVFIN